MVFCGGFAERFTGPVRQFDVVARNGRGVIARLEELYPGLGDYLEKNSVIAIDGLMYEVVYHQSVPAGGEILFIPKIESG